MAKRSFEYVTATALRVVLRDFSTGVERLWNTSGTPAFEAYNAAHIANYGITPTEGTTGEYLWTVPATLPASSVGFEYKASMYVIAGSNLATGDLPNIIGIDPFEWTGTEEITKSVIIASASGAGDGAFTYTITVNDGGSSLAAVSGATVSLTNGPNVYTATSNVSGVATFNVNPAAYVIAAAKSGYTYGGGAVTISANGNTTISMSINVVPPSAPAGQTTAYYYTEVPATVIAYKMTATPTGNGFEYVGIQRQVTSDGTTGYWSAPLYKGATYKIQCGTGPALTIVIPMNAGGTLALNNLLGPPS